jgi:hypothetical protein
MFAFLIQGCNRQRIDCITERFANLDTEDQGREDYIERIKRELDAWKAKPPSVLGYAASSVLAPVGWFISRVLPTSAVMGALNGFDWVAKQTLTPAGSADGEDLAECDRRADQVQTFHIALASAEGAAVGFVGLPGIPADIAATITLALRMVRQVGVEYGYGGNDEFERQFCLSVLQGAGANTMKEKIAAQLALVEISNMVAKQAWSAMAAKAATDRFSREAGITLVRALAKQLGINLTKRKALQAIPLLGAAIGGASNAWFLRDVGLAAQKAYQERWLIDRGHLIVAPPPS